MRIDEFDYDLPPELIAQTPLQERDKSRLLHLKRATGEVAHRQFRDTLEILCPGDLLVLNDTRVSARRLFGNRPSGGAVEALLLEPRSPDTFLALVRPAKRLKVGATIQFLAGISATVVAEEAEGMRVLTMAGDDWQAKLMTVGQTPLPPYIVETLSDEERYQTTYGVTPGSAAAPTAGLHFTPEILAGLKNRGVQVTTVTLHVSLDTFRPVLSETVAEHQMHGEVCEISEESANIINSAKGRIIAVGTTTVRTLESMAVGPRKVRHGQLNTRIFITPGFDFQIVDGMFTNFHLPKTTMLLMISALATPEAVKIAYAAAITERYRFLSFGDSMLIL